MKVVLLIFELVLISVAMIKFDLITVVGMSAMFILGQVWAISYDLEKLLKLEQAKKGEP